MSPIGTAQPDQRLRVVPVPNQFGAVQPVSSMPSPPLRPGPSSVPAIAQPVPTPRRVTFGRVLVTLLALMFCAASIGTNATYAISQGISAFDQFVQNNAPQVKGMSDHDRELLFVKFQQFLQSQITAPTTH